MLTNPSLSEGEGFSVIVLDFPVKGGFCVTSESESKLSACDFLNLVKENLSSVFFCA